MKKKSNLNVTSIKKDDYSDWVMLRGETWRNASKKDLEETFENILVNKNVTAFVCRTSGGDAVGYAEVSLRNDYVEGSSSSPVGYIEEIVVRRKYRNRGVARMLVRKAEEWARAKGCTEMGSDTELKNTASQKFHKALGFREAERSVSYIKKIKRT